MTVPKLEVLVEPQPAREYLGELARQVPFATALAINRTAEEAQAEEQAGVRERFVIRAEFVPRSIKFEKGNRATKENLVATLSVDKRAGFLMRFEQGGLQQMQPEARYGGLALPFAIPTKALRPMANLLIERGMYPKNLGFLPRRDPGGQLIFAGTGKHSRRKGIRKKYFAMRPGGTSINQPGGGVWIRTGSGAGLPRGSDRITMLWTFRSSLRIPASLQFTETTKRVIAKRYAANFDGMMAHAIATAR